MYELELSYAQKRSMIEQLEDVLDFDLDRQYPADTILEVVDSWMPVYYNRIREEWIEAGCPNPVDTMSDNLSEIDEPIHHLMALGLWEVAYQFAHGAIWGQAAGEANTHREALENLRENYPDWVAQKITTQASPKGSRAPGQTAGGFVVGSKNF